MLEQTFRMIESLLIPRACSMPTRYLDINVLDKKSVEDIIISSNGNIRYEEFYIIEEKIMRSIYIGNLDFVNKIYSCIKKEEKYIDFTECNFESDSEISALVGHKHIAVVLDENDGDVFRIRYSDMFDVKISIDLLSSLDCFDYETCTGNVENKIKEYIETYKSIKESEVILYLI